MYAKEKHHKQGEKLKTEKVSDSLSKIRREPEKQKGRKKKKKKVIWIREKGFSLSNTEWEFKPRPCRLGTPL